MNINFDALTTAGDNLISKAGDLKAELTKIQTSNGNVAAAWEGTDQAAYTEKVKAQEAQMETLIKTIEEIGSFLKNVSAKYEALQSEIANTIRGKGE